VSALCFTLEGTEAFTSLPTMTEDGLCSSSGDQGSEPPLAAGWDPPDLPWSGLGDAPCGAPAVGVHGAAAGHLWGTSLVQAAALGCALGER